MPYEADISAALQRLREDVFARGEYEYGDVVLTDDQRKAFLDLLPPDWRQKVNEEAAKLEEPMKGLYLHAVEMQTRVLSGGDSTSRKPKRKPKTIEGLLNRQAESGTHSILDMVGISSEPQLNAINPLPRAQLVECFKSETPSRAEIEEAYSSGSLEASVSKRWQGIYVIAYRDGLPAEIFFAGCSGD